MLDSLRSAVLNRTAFADLWQRTVILLVAGVVIGALASLLLRLTMRNVRRTGRLGQF